MSERKYYVYEWIRLDTNEPFYVGKGCGNRAYHTKKSRNAKFKAIANSVDCAVVILMDNLTDDEAYQYEVWFINEYRYVYGFDLANMDDGGLGAVSGKLNYMYGRKGCLHPNYNKKLPEETRMKMSLAHIGARNPMYGKRGERSPLYGRKATMERRLKISEALKGKPKSEEHRRKISELAKTRTGKKNPNYGNGHKIAGSKNPSAIKVVVYNKSKEIEFVGCKNEVAEKYNISLYLLNKLRNKVINVERDFSREKEKYRHIDGYEFKM